VLKRGPKRLPRGHARRRHIQRTPLSLVEEESPGGKENVPLAIIMLSAE